MQELALVSFLAQASEPVLTNHRLLPADVTKGAHPTCERDTYTNQLAGSWYCEAEGFIGSPDWGLTEEGIVCLVITSETLPFTQAALMKNSQTAAPDSEETYSTILERLESIKERQAYTENIS